MARGKRKTGQFYFKLWFPDGSRIELMSTRDHPAHEWRQFATEYLMEFQQHVARWSEDTSEPKDAGRGERLADRNRAHHDT